MTPPLPGTGPVQVTLAEVNTGIVLDTHGRRFVGGGPPPVLEFASLEEARAFSQRRIQEQPQVECVLKRPSDGHVEVLRADPAQR
ncbi:hypothetical protein HJC10_26635 [Corallococcus exiguus]|uniref:hypothetical protein n=1 Tax=Corallococcus TaxID=83461 RepID=UPI000EED29A7|nr:MULTISPECIES: hypothetical protein [Corallococcus]NNC06414.1 hypothetical protein [Corallococcus exiguus]NPC51089.1 hypothetical protein [Corallococcus exiguus]NPD25283.1 hypothetical protein [Corallococcus exiguus]RKH82585.1 hypothetical protein D7X99_15430 [Corallococcus sp. AB032C]